MKLNSALCTRFRLLFAIVLWGVIASASRADLFWQSVGYSDEQGITNGSSLTGGGTTFTYATTIFSDFDGGTFDLDAGVNASYFSYEGGVLGNDTGYLELSFNNRNNDPADYLELSLISSNPLQNVQFSLLGIDRSAGGNYSDAVEVFYNGINVRTNPSFFSFGASVGLDDESYMDGFEGIGTAAAGSTAGNLNFNFGSTFVNSLTIRYFTSDDSGNNPPNQAIGLGDLQFVAIPEPATVWCFVAALCLPCFAIRRRG